MAEKETVIVLDFGGQYKQLIARRVRECGVYCEIRPCGTPLGELLAEKPAGFIFTGGPNSVYDPGAPDCDHGIYGCGIPILGICYGCQLLAQSLGGLVTAAGTDNAREYGRTATDFDGSCPLFAGLPEQSVTWMSHGDYMARVPDGFTVTAVSRRCPNAAIADGRRKFYGVQFHPEVAHTQYGADMLRHFVLDICGCSGTWTMSDFRRSAVAALREEIGEGRVLLALSGGVDSSVLAALLSQAVGERLTCVFVDHGLMRKDEGDEIEAAFSGRAMNFVRINAGERFLARLAGVTDPQEKRRRIGAEFGYVFCDAADAFGITPMDYLAQGTIYPDLIESGEGDAQVIKSHHNRLLPPETLARFKGVLEPLSRLFKDEVRALGRELGLPEALVTRQPFPGPGLAVRIIGEVTEEKANTLREADYIMRREIALAGEDKRLSQYFAVLTELRSVGVMGDGRSYERMLALRAVNTSDFMTADWARIPYELLERISVSIVNEVPGINRIVYDITSKPPATVEWE